MVVYMDQTWTDVVTGLSQPEVQVAVTVEVFVKTFVVPLFEAMMTFLLVVEETGSVEILVEVDPEDVSVEVEVEVARAEVRVKAEVTRTLSEVLSGPPAIVLPRVGLETVLEIDMSVDEALGVEEDSCKTLDGDDDNCELLERVLVSVACAKAAWN
jgi:hypothetical protein